MASYITDRVFRSLPLLMAVTTPAVASAQGATRVSLKPPNAATSADFTRITSIRELLDGSVLVGDPVQKQLALVHLGSAGVRTIGRIGQGPGEYRSVGLLYPLSRDSTLFVDSRDGRWNILDGDRIVSTLSPYDSATRLVSQAFWGADSLGHVLGASGFDIRSGSFVETSRVRADSLVLFLVDRRSSRSIVVAHLKGRGFTGVQKLKRALMMNTPIAAEDQALLFSDGWIAVAYLSPYRVDWRRPNGTWIRGPPLPFRRIRVDDREKCAAMARWIRSSPCNPSLVKGWPAFVPPFLPDQTPRLLAAPNDELIIPRTPTADGRGNRYDVVDRSGHLRGVISLGTDTTVIGFGTHSIYTVATDADGLETLQRRPWP